MRTALASRLSYPLARFRHRLTHCSHGFRESCLRCVHRSARRLLANFNHLCSELIKLTSQHLSFLSRCHRHSISQYRNTRNRSIPHFQDNLLRYPVRMGNHAKRVEVRCALWMMRAYFLVIRLGPKTSLYHMKVIVVSTASGCDVTNWCKNIARVQQAEREIEREREKESEREIERKRERERERKNIKRKKLDFSACCFHVEAMYTVKYKHKLVY